MTASPIVLSLQCSLLSGLINIPWTFNWILARKKFEGRFFFNSFVHPPSSAGSGYFIDPFQQNSPLGRWLYEIFSIRCPGLKGVVLASAVVSSPLMIQAIKQSLERSIRVGWLRGSGR